MTYGNPIVTPEMFGAVGDGNPLTGTGTDDTAAFTAMYNAARTAGFIHTKWTAGKTYCITNPYLFAGVPVHIIDGNGANLMNIRVLPVGGQDQANFQTFAQANPFWLNGAAPATSITGSMGQLINSVAADATSITVQSGNCPTGPVLIYGFNRLGSLGFPPCPACFEYNYVVSAAGATGTLRTPTQYAYDAQWLALNLSFPGDQPSILGLNINNPAVWCDYVHITEVNFIQNPLFVGTLTSGTNGSCVPSGADTFIFENCRMASSDATMCGKVYYRGCTFYANDNDGVQLDKIVDLVHFKDCTFAKGCPLTGAVGIKEVMVEDCIVSDNTGLAPIDHYYIKGGKWMGRDYQSSAALLGDVVCGSAQVIIDRPTFIVPSTCDRVMESHIKSGVVTVASTNTLTMTRAAYDAAQFCHLMRIGAIMRNLAAIPAFRITRLPYTLGDPVTGTVQFDGDNLTNITTGDTLYMPCAPDVTLNDPLYSGTNAAQITSFWGTQFFAVPYPLGRTRDRYIGDDFIRITSNMESIARTSNIFRMELGNLFAISEVVINVSRAAVSSTAVSMNLNYVDAAATSNQLFQSIDLKTVGKRIVDHGGGTTLGADTFGTSGIGATTAAQIKWQDTWVTTGDMVQPNLPQWSITFYGDWIGGYEGVR